MNKSMRIFIIFFLFYQTKLKLKCTTFREKSIQHECFSGTVISHRDSKCFQFHM